MLSVIVKDKSSCNSPKALQLVKKRLQQKKKLKKVNREIVSA